MQLMPVYTSTSGDVSLMVEESGGHRRVERTHAPARARRPQRRAMLR
eukprot:CAMPEP_0202789194 /NCGR_PEP_ID=MMETSP1388-20130828/76678_1 /ASSEMBLY_ACC=CAM_ASM_000864 /TAXON_ID=37098 /ORGANISM="Isochrysis sp, Strain CCMP1244" /LENGTH=46 /DNA_ID= /DNA_START= /DNA_END= /DNA_ORIENTATION=